MSEDMSNQEKDTRQLCKYGEKCYQKNSEHHKKYKHPQKIKTPIKERACSPQAQPHKKRKVNDDEETNQSTSALSDKEDDAEHLDKTQNDSVETSVQKDPTEFIKEYFLVEMPDDFYALWDFCKELNEKDPLNALNIVDLQLVGPYDVLAGKFNKITKTKEECLRHWRFYYDPPEFQTVIRSFLKNGFHIGYYRDDPKDAPCFVCSGTLENGELDMMAENLFGALNVYLEGYMKKYCTPFNKMKVSKFQAKLVEWMKCKNISTEKTDKVKKRNLKVVAKSFNKIGIVVPYNKKTQLGYRQLIESGDNIKKILKNIVEAPNDDVRDDFFSKLQPIITMANIAADECDFGTQLELGLNLFAYGDDIFNPIILSLLVTANNLLKRDAFVEIIKAHLKHRNKSRELSILK